MRKFFLEVAMILKQRDQLFDFGNQVGNFHLDDFENKEYLIIYNVKIK